MPEYTPPVAVLLTDVAASKTWKDIRAGYLSLYAAPISVYLDAPSPFIIVDPDHTASVAQAVAGVVQDIDGNALCSCVTASAQQQTELLKFHYESLTKAGEKKKQPREKGKRGKNSRAASAGPVYVGEEKFSTSQDVFDKIKGIMREYKDAQPLMGDDRKFMLDVFSFHPRGAEKLKYMRQVIIKENESFSTANQCFFIVKKDNVEEDISYVKCVNNLPSTPQPIL